MKCRYLFFGTSVLLFVNCVFVFICWDQSSKIGKGMRLFYNTSADGFLLLSWFYENIIHNDSMVQWQDCWPECWEAWGPEFNPRPGRVGVRFLYKLGQPAKTFISYSLLSVAQLLEEITLKSIICISYYRSRYLCRLHMQKALLPSCLSHP